jgi:hypothetical protein
VAAQRAAMRADRRPADLLAPYLAVLEQKAPRR